MDGAEKATISEARYHAEKLSEMIDISKAKLAQRKRATTTYTRREQSLDMLRIALFPLLYTSMNYTQQDLWRHGITHRKVKAAFTAREANEAVIHYARLTVALSAQKQQ